MRGRPSQVKVEIADATRATWEGWLRRQKTPVGLATRARAMLLLAAGHPYTHTAAQVGLAERHGRQWATRFVAQGIAGLQDQPRPGRRPVFPPAVALHVVTIACERPDDPGRSLCQGDCAAIARTLVADGLVEDIADETVRRILRQHTLKPWRHHLWLSAKRPRDAAVAPQVQALADLPTRPLAPWEVVLRLDEQASLPPRTRLAPTRPARRGQPVRVEHAYKRGGALHLCAAFDTRSGHVSAATAPRRCQVECIAFLEQRDQEIPASITTIHLVLDNVRMQMGTLVRAWLALHPRFCSHVPPVHCSWRNHGEQWFSMVQRKRLRFADVADLAHLAERLQAFVAEWNQHAHPFNWSRTSVAKVMAPCEGPLPLAA